MKVDGKGLLKFQLHIHSLHVPEDETCGRTQEVQSCFRSWTSNILHCCKCLTPVSHSRSLGSLQARLMDELSATDVIRFLPVHLSHTVPNNYDGDCLPTTLSTASVLSTCFIWVDVKEGRKFSVWDSKFSRRWLPMFRRTVSPPSSGLNPVTLEPPTRLHSVTTQKTTLEWKFESLIITKYYHIFRCYVKSPCYLNIAFRPEWAGTEMLFHHYPTVHTWK
jgi:hypothetical protein